MISRLRPNLFNAIQHQIEQGYIRAVRHPKLPLTIYKYTRKAEADHYWPEEVRICRGLVLDDSHNVVILPPPKFFNYTELEAPEVKDASAWECLEKLDGYYIAIKQDSKYGLVITSSGSFENKYTQAAEELIPKKKLAKGVSYFCELCQNFPEDRGLIVAKHDTPRLVCWGMRLSTMGKEADVLSTSTTPFVSVHEIGFEKLHEYLQQEVEGVVLFNPTTRERIKMKTKWWFDVHAEIGFCSKRRIFDMMRGGAVFDFDSACTWYNYADTKHEHPNHWDGTRLPDELHPRVECWRKEIQETIDLIEGKAQSYYETWAFESDAELARNLAIPSAYRKIVFNKRRKKDYSRLLWNIAERKLFPKEEK